MCFESRNCSTSRTSVSSPAMLAACAATGATTSSAAARALMQTSPVAGGQSLQRNSYEVWNDGERLLLNSSRAAVAQVPRTTVVLNWAAALGKK